MTRLERAAARQPSLYPFGADPVPRMSAADEATAGFEARLRAAWPYIVCRSKRFCATLSPRERAHLSEEDLVQAVAKTLLERDHKFDRARGRYVTFVDRVTRNVLVDQREKARVVSAPANAAARLRKLRAKREAVGLSTGQEFTMGALERALSDCEELSADDGPEAAPPPDPDAAPGGDTLAALMRLESPVMVAVLAWSVGLFGGPELDAAEIAAKLPGGLSPLQVKSLQGRAGRSLRGRIERIKECKR